MSWISVDERLPDISSDVLIYCNGTHIAFLSWEFDHDSETEFYVWQIHDGHFDLDQVTHWQPLPEPPEN